MKYIVFILLSTQAWAVCPDLVGEYSCENNVGETKTIKISQNGDTYTVDNEGTIEVYIADGKFRQMDLGKFSGQVATKCTNDFVFIYGEGQIVDGGFSEEAKLILNVAPTEKGYVSDLFVFLKSGHTGSEVDNCQSI